MAEETENTTTEQVVETQEVQDVGTQDVETQETEQTEQTEQTQEVKTGQTEEKPEKSIVDKIGDILSKAKNAVTGGGEDEGDVIPDEFTTAMAAAGYSDDDIEGFAGGQQKNEKGEWVNIEGQEPYSNEQLLEMIPSLTGADATKVDETAGTPETQVEAVEEKVEDNQDGEELKQLREDVAALKKAQGISEKESKEAELVSFVSMAHDLFDGASEEFEIFGKTESLPRFPDGRIIPTSPQMKARNEVWDTAAQLRQAGVSNDKALEISLNAYKGANLATETKRNVIKDLKTREQKLGGKRISHETIGGGDKNLSGPEVIVEVGKRAGVEIPP